MLSIIFVCDNELELGNSTFSYDLIIREQNLEISTPKYMIRKTVELQCIFKPL